MTNHSLKERFTEPYLRGSLSERKNPQNESYLQLAILRLGFILPPAPHPPPVPPTTSSTYQVNLLSLYPERGCTSVAFKVNFYVRWANFTTKPCFDIVELQSFAWVDSQDSRVERNTHSQRLQIQRILLRKEAWWWNLPVLWNRA